MSSRKFPAFLSISFLILITNLTFSQTDYIDSKYRFRFTIPEGWDTIPKAVTATLFIGQTNNTLFPLSEMEKAINLISKMGSEEEEIKNHGNLCYREHLNFIQIPTKIKGDINELLYTFDLKLFKSLDN